MTLRDFLDVTRGYPLDAPIVIADQASPKAVDLTAARYILTAKRDGTRAGLWYQEGGEITAIVLT